MTSEHFKGEDLETRVKQLEEAMAQLKGDSRLSNLPYGTLKQAASMLSIRSVGGSGGAYPAGCLPVVATTSTAAWTANILYALPFYLPGVPNVLSKIGIRVTTGAAGNYRLGIYADKGEDKLWPHKLLLDAGTVDTGTTGVKSKTVRKELPRGLIWVVMIGSATPTITVITTDMWTPIGWSEDAVTKYVLVKVAYTYGVLPDPFPAGGVEYGLGIPYIFLKFG